MAKKDYIFTNKEHPKTGVMSTVLGVLSVGSLILAAYLSYVEKGAENMRYGAACFLALIFAFVGIVLGAVSKTERDKFYLFSYVGIALNLAAVGLASLILYAGALL